MFDFTSEQSNQTNKSRLRVLQTREQHLDSLFDGARQRLPDLTKDQAKYGELLKSLIVQGLLQLMEEKVVVTARSSDVDLVKKAAGEAEAAYKDKSGRSTKIEVKEGLQKDW